MNEAPRPWSAPPGANALLGGADFARLTEFIYQTCGINLAGSKKVMLEARLRRRLKALRLPEFQDYCDYLFSPEGQRDEIVHLIDAVTTNKTDFFRESGHFEFLVGTALPALLATGRRGVAVWSAGCSSGEEPYTLAMVLSEFAGRAPGFAFSVLATDISTQVLSLAARGVYTAEHAAPIPDGCLRRYMLRGKGTSAGLVKVSPALRAHVSFRRLNFLSSDFGMRELQDVIFCRNVIIYFDRATQQRVLTRLKSHLSPGGFLFMGHSETLSGLDLGLQPVGPMVYRKDG